MTFILRAPCIARRSASSETSCATRGSSAPRPGRAPRTAHGSVVSSRYEPVACPSRPHARALRVPSAARPLAPRAQTATATVTRRLGVGRAAGARARRRDCPRGGERCYIVGTLRACSVARLPAPTPRGLPFPTDSREGREGAGVTRRLAFGRPKAREVRETWWPTSLERSSTRRMGGCPGG